MLVTKWNKGEATEREHKDHAFLFKIYFIYVYVSAVPPEERALCLLDMTTLLGTKFWSSVRAEST